MKLCCISDTHRLHDRLAIPECDVLIHAGDATTVGSKKELNEFFEWFGVQKAHYKLYAPGNHDKEMEVSNYQVPSNIICLNDSSLLIEGVKFYGSPWTPAYGEGWAYNILRGELKAYWDLIPSDVQVLITHGPPLSILDKDKGCQELQARVNELKRLQAHIFGHIHEGAGEVTLKGVKFVNASMSYLGYDREPVVFEI